MRRWIALGLSLVTACAGKAPHGTGALPDAPDDTDAATDATPSPVVAAVSGKTIDYFGNVNMKSAALASDGLDPQLTATSSGTDASYSLDVPVGSKLYVVASKTGYRPTRSTPIKVADMPVAQDIYAMT